MVDKASIPSLASSIRTAFAGRIAAHDGLDALLGFIAADAAWTDIRHIAYLLATVHHETAGTHLPITEYGNPSYFRRYDPDTHVGKRLGNTETGDGYKFRGRGYCQITGRANYARFSELLKLDLVNDPDKTLDPETAYKIISLGMRDGLFTGKKLSNYINTDRCDYHSARRIINGLDCAALIAEYASVLEGLLREVSNAA